MTAISVVHGSTPTLILAKPSDPWRFCHILNNSNATVYIQYDGSSATLTTSNGMPILPGQTFTLENGAIELFKDAIYGIHGDVSLDKEVRIQNA